jgi:hypothetical protein
MLLKFSSDSIDRKIYNSHRRVLYFGQVKTAKKSRKFSVARSVHGKIHRKGRELKKNTTYMSPKLSDLKKYNLLISLPQSTPRTQRFHSFSDFF